MAGVISSQEIYAVRHKVSGKIKHNFNDYDVAREWLEDFGSGIFELVYRQEVLRVSEWEPVDKLP